MSIDTGLYRRTFRETTGGVFRDEVLFSSDSHVMEPADTIVSRVPRPCGTAPRAFPS